MINFADIMTITPGAVTVTEDGIWLHGDDEGLTKLLRVLSDFTDHPFLLETHNGRLGDFTSPEHFIEAARAYEVLICINPKLKGDKKAIRTIVKKTSDYDVSWAQSYIDSDGERWR